MSTYEWNAADYKKNSQAQLKWAKELIEKLDLQGTEDVLDLGCGDGKVTAEIAALLPKGSILGIDNAQSMVELAGRHYPTKTYPNIFFKVMDASHLIFSECFDLVFSNAVLHWIKNHEPVMKGLHQSLRRGGKILLQMGGEGNASEILSVLKEMQGHPEWKHSFDHFAFPYGFFGIEAYESLLHDAGFDAKRIELIPKKMEHAGQSALEGWIRTTWLPYTARIPEKKRDQFITEIATKYIDRVPMDSDGTVHVSMVRIEVEAEKE